MGTCVGLFNKNSQKLPNLVLWAWLKITFTPGGSNSKTINLLPQAISDKDCDYTTLTILIKKFYFHLISLLTRLNLKG